MLLDSLLHSSVSLLLEEDELEVEEDELEDDDDDMDGDLCRKINLFSSELVPEIQ